jgi:hypothetical protein
MVSVINESGSVSVPAFDIRQVVSAQVPDRFISVQLNGGIRTLTTGYDLFACHILVQINVRLLSNGSINIVAENKILKEVEELLERVGWIKGVNMVYVGKSLYTDYSTKMINILCHITKTNT